MCSCPICGSSVENIFLSKENISVSSDNRLLFQPISLFVCKECGHLLKTPNKEVLDELYSTYITDSILPNEEQLKFDSFKPKSLSARVLENSYDFIPKKPSPKMLDYGVGGGGMFHSFLNLFPASEVYGFDVSNHNVGLFDGIIKGFWTNLEDITEKFHCITLIHCLEHISNVNEVILKLRNLLLDDGILIIQVPDVEDNIWDIFVYDHIHHFSRSSLELLLTFLGFEVIFPEQQIDRQITLICRKSDKKKNLKLNGFSFPIAKLKNNLKILQQIKDKKNRVAVFGTSTISTFVGALLGDSLEKFLDEDKRKIGRTHLGVSIVSPNLYSGDVVMPFGGDTYKKILCKYQFSALDVF